MNQAEMRRCIERKRDGEKLQEAELVEMMASFLSGEVPEAQMAAFCMASVWRGLDIDEAYALTKATVQSGRTIKFRSGAVVVDKHSTGGVADIVSLVAVPLVAACGVSVAKLSGRALGHTGGTIDKLESIPGFNAHLSAQAFVKQVESIGCAIAAQTDDMVPADRRLYALRDATATVPSRGLISASVVSKKVAGGAGAFVFDVKAGRGSFMRDVDTAAELARLLVHVAARFGKPARALVTNMNEPLGTVVGTGLEVIEARDFLRGVRRDARARMLCIEIGTAMLEAAGVEKETAVARLQGALDDGRAYEKFAAMIEAQGAHRSALEEMTPTSMLAEIRAPRSGFLAGIDVVTVGNLGRVLSSNDSCGGVQILKRIGEQVDEREPLARLFSRANVAQVTQATDAFEISVEKPIPEPLIFEAV